MNKSILMMTALLTLTGMNFQANAAEARMSVAVARDYETKWCRDASFVLRNSLEAAYDAETFEQEVAILKRAIAKTLSTLNPKFTYYLESSLLLAQELEAIVTTPKDKALLMRRSIDSALDDLEFLDAQMSNRRDQDHTGYVSKVLQRVSDEALRSKTDLIEMTILNSGARAGVQVLSESDNRRDPKNACAVRFLKEVLELNDVIYKRGLVQDAIDSLGRGCRY